jgi:hypothetical protein
MQPAPQQHRKGAITDMGGGAQRQAGLGLSLLTLTHVTRAVCLQHSYSHSQHTMSVLTYAGSISSRSIIISK